MSGGRARRSPLFGRRARIAVLAAVVLALGVTGYRVLTASNDRADRSTRWRLHDEAVVMFEAGQYEAAAALYEQILIDQPGDLTARFNLGLARVRLGDQRGWADVESVAVADPNFDAAHQMIATRALEEGDVAKAARELALVVDVAPAPPETRRLLAALQLELGRRRAAMEQLEILARDTDAAAALRAQAALDLARQYGRRRAFHRAPTGEMRREQEWYGNALRISDEALRSDDVPGREQLLAVRPFVLLALDKQREALAAVEVALREELAPQTRAQLQLLRAQMYWLAGDGERAESEIAAAIAGSPPSLVFAAVADVFAARGFPERALDLLEQGRELHPGDAVLRTARAEMLFGAGRPDEAEEVLRDGQEWPVSIDDLVLLGDFRRARGDLAGARRAYERVLDLDPRRTDVELSLKSAASGLSVTRASITEEARAELEATARAALESDPRSPRAQLALARALVLRHGDPDATEEARRLLVDSIDGDPLVYETHVLLAVANLAIGRSEDAVVGLERLIEALPAERPELRLLLSRAYGDIGSSRQSLVEAQRAVDVLGDDVDALETLVRAARMAGRRDVALEALGRLTRLQPDDVRHLLAQAFVHIDAGDVAKAEQSFAVADAVAEGIADQEAMREALRQVVEARAIAYTQRGDANSARGAFAGLVERLPGDVVARVRYGRFLQATGDVDEAARVFQAAIAMAPDAMPPRRALVDLWCTANEVTPELAAMVSRMRVLGGDAPDVLAAEGKLAALQGDLRLARERLEACVAEAPDDAEAQFALGLVLTRAGVLDKAIAALVRAAKLIPKAPLIREALARARFARAKELARYGRVREARGLLEQTVAADPGSGAPRAALAELLVMGGDLSLGEAEVRAMVARDPDDAMARRMLAALLVRRGATADAVKELIVATERNADDWTVWASLSAAYLELESAGPAEDAARRARAVAPDEPGSLSPMLQVLVDTERVAEAGALVDEALAAAPEEYSYLVLRAMVHSVAEEYPETVSACRAALKLRPGTFEAVDLAARTLRWRLGDPEGALTILRDAVESAPDDPRPRYSLGAALSARGDRAEALEILGPALTSEPPSSRALALAALIHMEGRDTAAARDLAEQALELNPEDFNLHYMIAQSWLMDAQADGDPEVKGSRRDLVIKRLETVLGLYENHHTARNNLAYVLAAEPESLPAAYEHAQTAAEAAPGHAPYLDTVGTILLRMGRRAEAASSFQAGLEAVEAAEAQLRSDASLPMYTSDPGLLQRRKLKLAQQRAELQLHLDEALGR